VVWELCGAVINVEKWLEIAAEVEAKRDDVQSELERLITPEHYWQKFEEPICRITQRDAVIGQLTEHVMPEFFAKDA
jgi:hypothetical protein